jgi:hypothetical protein
MRSSSVAVQISGSGVCPTQAGTTFAANQEQAVEADVATRAGRQLHQVVVAFRRHKKASG